MAANQACTVMVDTKWDRWFNKQWLSLHLAVAQTLGFCFLCTWALFHRAIFHVNSEKKNKSFKNENIALNL